MTNQEAIAILVREKDEDPFMRTEYREQIHEALDMAIQALSALDKVIAYCKQSPSAIFPEVLSLIKGENVEIETDYGYEKFEPCDNAVSRQAAIDAMYELSNTGETLEENPWRDNPHIDAITDAIDNLPPVNTQEPLTKEDYIELHDRFGDYVVFVVKDMVSGKGERWSKNNLQEPKYCDRNICVSNEYNGIGCNECEVTKSQEPKTGHFRDCISRQAVHILIHELEEALVYEKNYISRERDTTTIIEDILALPPVNPQPKTGHWIMTGNYYTGAYGSIDYVECSCCHEDSLEEGDYCPNCGCRMVEPQESEDKE